MSFDLQAILESKRALRRNLAARPIGDKLRMLDALFPHPRHPRNPRFILMLHDDITKDIIGSAMVVLNELRPGLDEKLYENALVIELVARGHVVEQQREYPVHYRGQFIGKLIPDIIVDGKVIADPKVVTVFMTRTWPKCSAT